MLVDVGDCGIDTTANLIPFISLPARYCDGHFLSEDRGGVA